MSLGKLLPEALRGPLRKLLIKAKSGRLGRNRMTYRFEKSKHFRTYAPNVEAAPDKEIFEELVSDGVTVIRDFLDNKTIEKIVSEVKKPIQAVANNNFTGPQRTVFMPESGVYRILDVDKEISPASRAFFDHPFLQETAAALSTSGVNVKDRYVDFKIGPGCEDGNFIHHTDHWRLRFKTFLLLNDIGPDNAPFVYIKRSHREDHWRQRYDREFYLQGYDFSTFTPQHARRITEKYGYEEISITGSAGDLIIANTRGIHRGSILRDGTRLQLAQLFVAKE
jgi:hypothetical protein